MAFFHTVVEPAEGHALQMEMPFPTPTHPGVEIKGVWPGRGSAALPKSPWSAGHPPWCGG